MLTLFETVIGYKKRNLIVFLTIFKRVFAYTNYDTQPGHMQIGIKPQYCSYFLICLEAFGKYA